MLKTSTVLDIVKNEIRTLLEDDLDTCPDISPETSLHDLALNSLLLARLIIVLEMEIGVDPFAAGYPITDVRTVGDLAGAYEKSIADGNAELAEVTS